LARLDVREVALLRLHHPIAHGITQHPSTAIMHGTVC
jgi:hypothetical protein